jgi:hypothetical protein
VNREVQRHREAPGPEADPHRQALYGALAAELTRRALQFRWAPDHQHLTDAELWVTPEVWIEARALVDEASARLHHAAQPAGTSGTIRGNASFVMFEMGGTP